MRIKHSIAFILAASLAAAVLYPRDVRAGLAIAATESDIGSRSSLKGLISTAPVQRRSFTLRVPWTGVVESRDAVELTAPIAGRIDLIGAQDQAPVEKGHEVVRLGGPQLDAQRSKLVIEIQSLESRRRLGAGVVQRLQRDLKAKLATKNQVAAARTGQEELEALLNEARSSLEAFDNTVRITAPINGIFTNRRVAAGQNVSAGQFIGEIIDASRLRIVAWLFPPQGMALQGKPVDIALDPNHISGSVQRILPRAAGTGAVAVWIQSPQMKGRLLAGQTVSGSLIARAEFSALAVPRSAIVYDTQERPYVFIRKGGGYVVQSVRLGLTQDGWAEVLTGLAQDQLVVTRGAYELFYRHFNDQFKVED